MKNLRLNGLKKSLGYNLDYQRFTWNNLEPTPKYVKIINQQTSEIIYQCKVLKTQNSLELKLALEGSQKYRAIFSSEELELDTFDFETAKDKSDWKASWITSNINNPVYTKSFEVYEISDARIYICALGIYQLKINGQKITNEVLLPGYYSYDLWHQGNTFDVSDYLKVGLNDIEIIITDGWYKGRLGFSGGATNQYGEELKFICELYESPHQLTLKSDLSWNVCESYIQFSNIYDGEVQDYTKIPKAGEAQLTDSHFEIEARLNNPIIKQERLDPEITMIKPREYLLDFKQNLTGWIEFDGLLAYGETLSYQVGELLQKGKFYRDNLRTAKAEFKYVSDGQQRHVEPLGTFYGFRYAYVKTDADIYSLDIHARVIHSHFEKTGNFECDSVVTNRLYQNIIWGQKGNFLDIPTDCPQRDERLGWTGDAQVFFNTAATNYNVESFFRSFLWNLRLEQQQNNGAVPLFVPSLRKNQQPLGAGIAGWSDAGTIISWRLYEKYNNKLLLAETFPIIKDWADNLINFNQKNGNEYLWQSDFQLGDWLALDGKSPEIPIGGTDTTFIATVYFYISVLYAAKAALVLGDDKVEYYQEYAMRIKEALHDEFITKNGRLAINTQTAYAMVIEYQLFNEGQLESLKEQFLKKLFTDQFQIKTGFLGTPILLSSLTKVGLDKVAVNIFENQSYPGWHHTVKLGATTIWERWNTVLEDGTVNDQGMNSLNHYAYGSVGEWMYNHLLGLKVDEQHKTITINPNLSNNFKVLSGKVTTANGELKVKIDKCIANITIELEIPSGYVILNKVSTQKLSSGLNKLIINNNHQLDIEKLTICEVCSNYKLRAIVLEYIPFIFNDESIIRNLESPFILVRECISKKRMISKETLQLILNEMEEVLKKESNEL